MSISIGDIIRAKLGMWKMPLREEETSVSSVPSVPAESPPPGEEEAIELVEMMIADDGNCLFRAFVSGMGLKESIPAVRKKVVAWMRENLSENKILQEKLRHALVEHHAALQGRLKEEMVNLKVIAKFNSGAKKELVRVQKSLREAERMVAKLTESIPEGCSIPYFDEMVKEGAHGGAAEIYALSQLYQTSILIYRSVESGFSVHHEEKSKVSTKSVRLVHTNGNHYNRLLDFTIL